MVDKFGENNVYIATSNKTGPGSPFTFKEKRVMMMLTGVPASAIKQEISPYKPENTLSTVPKDTAAIFAVGQKDMAENPRFKPGLKKDGNPTYYQDLDAWLKAGKKLEGYETHGYLIAIPSVKFTVLNKPADSATQLRAQYKTLDDEKRKEFITDLFGQYDDMVKTVMDTKLTEDFNPQDHYDPKTGRSFVNKNHPEFKNRVFGGDKGIIVKQIKRLSYVIDDIEKLVKDKAIDKETMATIKSQLDRIGDSLHGTPVAEKWSKFVETLWQLNKEEPMDSEILIQGLGRMTLQQAIRRVKEYADEISRVVSDEDAWSHQGKLNHHIEILSHYNKAIQDAYKDLAAIRKKGGTRSRGIDKYIEGDVEADKKNPVAKKHINKPEWKALHDMDDDIINDYIKHKKVKEANDYGEARLLGIAQAHLSHGLEMAQYILDGDEFKAKSIARSIVQNWPEAIDKIQNVYKETIGEADSYSPPTIKVGDEVKVGRFKNRKAEVKGFTKDEHNQPVLKTNKGDQKLFKPRIVKLEVSETFDTVERAYNENKRSS